MKIVLLALCLAAGATAADVATVTPLITKDLIGIPGNGATMVTVEYAPGGSSAEHRHNAHTFVYVLEGSVTMQVKGGKEVTLGAGQTFYESPAHPARVGAHFGESRVTWQIGTAIEQPEAIGPVWPAASAVLELAPQSKRRQPRTPEHR